MFACHFRELLAVATVVGTTTVWAGSVIYVDDDAPAGGDGQTWNTAFRFLQDALTAAGQPGSGVTELRIAQGNYLPDHRESTPTGTGVRTESFQPSSGLAVSGGFAGILHSSPDMRDPLLYETVLNGDLNGDDGSDFANNGENSFHVVRIVLNTSNVVLDGLTVQSGNGNGPANLPETAWRGGGIRVETAALVSIINCRFFANSSTFGGGVHSVNGQMFIQDCLFEGNHAFGGGGGLDLNGPVQVVRACQVIANRAGHAAGARTSSFDASISDCRFANNQATGLVS